MTVGGIKDPLYAGSSLGITSPTVIPPWEPKRRLKQSPYARSVWQSVATNAEVAQDYPTCVDRHIWCDTRSMLADGLIHREALDIHHKDHVLLKIRSTLETTLDDTSNSPSGSPKP